MAASLVSKKNLLQRACELASRLELADGRVVLAERGIQSCPSSAGAVHNPYRGGLPAPIRSGRVAFAHMTVPSMETLQTSLACARPDASRSSGSGRASLRFRIWMSKGVEHDGKGLTLMQEAASAPAKRRVGAYLRTRAFHWSRRSKFPGSPQQSRL
ncbi:hypothetical protein T492DRAFT_990724 [Pavlovales sp. CCMP2436]|nr:hypothetical protein T492DRAFT_990724 [Pavlovales sp. CCMP2436]